MRNLKSSLLAIHKSSSFKAALYTLTLLLTANLSTLFNASLWGLSAILWIVLLGPVLGALILSLFLDVKKFEFSEWLVYSVGSSLAFLMLAGLAINIVGLVLNTGTLTRSVILPVINISLVALIIKLTTDRTRNNTLFPKLFAKFNWTIGLKSCIPILFPLISLLGVVQLNNNGSGFIALVSLALIAAYIIYFTCFARKRTDAEYIASILGISLALILSVSMRSNHLIGSDIHHEYQVFTTTLSNKLWRPSSFAGDSYNACLSITILPVIFHSVIPISAEYIYKFVLQVFFCIMPLIVFLIAKSLFTGHKLRSYITAIFFIAPGQFIFVFPSLVRQEIASLFFGMILLMNINSTQTKRTKTLFVLIFGLAMLVSHYSTAYVAIALFAVALLVKQLIKLLQRATNAPPTKDRLNLLVSPLILLVLLLGAFAWYGETLQATGGIVKKFSASITGISSILQSDTRGDFLVTTLGVGTPTPTAQLLYSIYNKQTVPNNYSTAGNQYQPTVAQSKGPVIESPSQKVIYDSAHKVIPLFANAMLIVGVVYIFYLTTRSRRLTDYTALSCASILLAITLIVLPYISQDYNFERFYEQILIILAPAYIFGFDLLLRKKQGAVTYVTAILAVLVLLCASGFTDQLFFHASNVNLNNAGTTYDKYYTSDGDVESLEWLSGHYAHCSINFDRYSYLFATSYSQIPSRCLKQGLLPTQVQVGSYVYVSSANIRGLAFGSYNNQIVTYSFPGTVYSQNKDMIYSSGNSQIYK